MTATLLAPAPSAAAPAHPSRRRGAARPPAAAGVRAPWLRAQAINARRHADAMRPFRREEFGTGAEAPTDGHIQAANALLATLRGELLGKTPGLDRAVARALADPATSQLQRVVEDKELVHNRVRAVEEVWDFYFELFGQRQSRFGSWLLSCDRIALDCYQVAYRGIAVHRTIPAPPPFSYMRTGFSPATFRRGIPLRRLGRRLNPFPLIQLPYHRLVNPWTLGAVLHEVSHNLQNDLGLAREIPRAIGRAILGRGLPAEVARTWTRWNREIFADLSGLLLGGPTIVGSLMDVIGRSPEATLAFSPRGPHPTPYLRTLISTELLRRMGFPEEAERYRRLWQAIYPDPRAGTIPPAMLDTFAVACPIVVDTICFRPYPSLGGRTLAGVFRFAPKDQRMIEEAGGRLAAGNDPGVVPERFMIGAARIALDRQLATPDAITSAFYRELARR